MTSLTYLLGRIFRSKTLIRCPVVPADVTGNSSVRLLSCSTNILRTSKSSDTNGNAKFDEDGFDITTLKDEEKEKLQVLKQRLAKTEYFQKYKDKLIQAQRSSPKVFVAKAEQIVCKTTKGASKKTGDKSSSQFKESQGLSGILNTEMMKTLDKDDIIFVWKAYNEKRGKTGDSIPGSVYNRIRTLASTHNMFLFPLPRNDGYEFYITQFSNNVFHFTPLVSYQTHGENSPVSLILAYYTELQESKDVILIMAEYNKKLMNPDDINVLYTQILFYYAYPDDKRLSLLSKFKETPLDFNHMDLIEEYEKLNKMKLPLK